MNWLIIVCLMGFAALLAALCLLLDPKDKRDSSFYGLMVSGLFFCIGFHYLVREVIQ